MQAYEAAIVFAPDVDEERFEALMTRIATLITSRGGKVDEPQKWGKRRLAYAIGRHHEGIYVFLPFESDVDTPAEVERLLRLTEDVIRFLVVRQLDTAPMQPAKAAPASELAPTEPVAEAGGSTNA